MPKSPEKTPRSKSSAPSTLAEITGDGGELHQIATGDHPRLTTNQGYTVGDDYNSLKAGTRGPVLLEVTGPH